MLYIRLCVVFLLSVGISLCASQAPASPEKFTYKQKWGGLIWPFAYLKSETITSEKTGASLVKDTKTITIILGNYHCKAECKRIKCIDSNDQVRCVNLHVADGGINYYAATKLDLEDFTFAEVTRWILDGTSATAKQSFINFEALKAVALRQQKKQKDSTAALSSSSSQAAKGPKIEEVE